MNPAHQAVLAEWQRGRDAAAAEIQALYGEATAGCQKLVNEHPTDMEPLVRALRALEVQLRQLEFKGADPVPDIGDKLQEAGRDDVNAALGYVKSNGRAFSRWAHERWRRFECQWVTAALHAMWPHVLEQMGKPAPCERCGSPLERHTPRQNESLTCSACGAVNQLTPHPMVAAYFSASHFLDESAVIDKLMAIRKFEDEWDDWVDAEWAAGRPRPEAPFERLETLERMKLDYWNAFFKSRVKNQGGSDKDVEKYVRDRMQLDFYAKVNRNDVWRAGKGLPSLSSLLDVPEALENVDEWGPLDPRTNPNAVEDNQVHEFVLSRALGEPERHTAMLRWLGYRDAIQRAQTKATFERHYHGFWSTPEGVASMQRAVNRANEEEQRFDREAADPSLLDPVEGVSAKLYGELEAKRAGTSPAEFVQFLATHELDQAKFDRVAQAFRQRMSDDRSGAIYAEYCQGLLAHAPTADSVSFEKFCEIQGAVNAWGKLGKDGNAELQRHFTMTVVDFSGIAMSYMQKMTAAPAMFEDFSKLTAEAEAKYLGQG